MKNRVIKIYVWGSDSDWRAICANFDIAVQGNSLNDVESLMEEAVVCYFEELEHLSKCDAKRLLKRRAPLWLRLWLHIRFSLHKSHRIFNKRINEIQKMNFTEFAFYETST